MKRFTSLVAFAVAFMCCSPTPPSPSTSTGAVPPSVTCADMCLHLASLKCDVANPSSLGGTCEDRCKVEAPALKWDLECRATVTTCDAIERCEGPVTPSHS